MATWESENRGRETRDRGRETGPSGPVITSVAVKDLHTIIITVAAMTTLIASLSEKTLNTLALRRFHAARFDPCR